MLATRVEVEVDPGGEAKEAKEDAEKVAADPAALVVSAAHSLYCRRSGMRRSRPRRADESCPSSSAAMFR